MFFKEKQPDHDNDQRKEEHKNRDAVDAMHVFYPAAPRRTWIFLFNIQVFSYLAQHSHINYLSSKINNKSCFALFRKNELLLPAGSLFFDKSSIFAIPMGD
jgi:hypothetical protein